MQSVVSHGAGTKRKMYEFRETVDPLHQSYRKLPPGSRRLAPPVMAQSFRASPSPMNKNFQLPVLLPNHSVVQQQKMSFIAAHLLARPIPMGQNNLSNLPETVLYRIISFCELKEVAILCCLHHSRNPLGALLHSQIVWNERYERMIQNWVHYNRTTTTHSFKRFCKQVWQTHCHHCGIQCTTSAQLGDFGQAAFDKLDVRYCDRCVSGQVISKAGAKREYIVTDRQLSTIPVLRRSSTLYYAKRHVEKLAIQRWRSIELMRAEKARRRHVKRYHASVENQLSRYNAPLAAITRPEVLQAFEPLQLTDVQIRDPSVKGMCDFSVDDTYQWANVSSIGALDPSPAIDALLVTSYHPSTNWNRSPPALETSHVSSQSSTTEWNPDDLFV